MCASKRMIFLDFLISLVALGLAITHLVLEIKKYVDEVQRPNVGPQAPTAAPILPPIQDPTSAILAGVATIIIPVVAPLRAVEKFCLVKRKCTNRVAVPFFAILVYLAATALQGASVGIERQRNEPGDFYPDFGIASAVLCGIAVVLYFIVMCAHCCDGSSEYITINN